MAFHYQLLASQLAGKIHSQALKADQRLSSLRDFARQHEVSLSTAQSCYELLEAQGLIYVRPRSGYFVKGRSLQNPLPRHLDFQSRPRDVSNLELQIEIQQASIQNNLVHLGAIQLSPQLVPVEALRRSIQRALKHSQPEDFLYSDRQGHKKLRQALSEHWAEDGLYIQPEDILITSGCMPALSLIIQQLTEVGDSILVPTPSFNGQLQLLASLKRKIIEIPASHAGVDLDRLEQMMQSGQVKACLMTANYQNPLGYCLTNTEKAQIAQLAERYRCYVIEDDIYAECGFNLERPLPIKYWDQAGYVIYCGSVSKSLSSAYRIGWVCISQQLQSFRIGLLNGNAIVNTPLQLALADLIYSRSYREHLNSLRPRLMQQVRQYQEYILKAFQGVKIGLSQPEGGYALWLEFPVQIDGLEMYHFAQQHGINIVPGEVFGEDRRYRHFIRLNAGHGLSHEICQSIDKLAEWVKQKLDNTDS